MRWRAVTRPLARPAALVAAGGLALAAAIFTNAIYLQTGRHPAPLFATRSAPAPTPVAAPDALVEAVQAALRDAGHYDGPVDGLAGPRTAAAISAFEARAGLARTGRAGPDILEALLDRTVPPPPGEPPAAAEATAPASVASVAADPRVAAVQSALSRAAYGQVVADGVFGPRTADAIRRFQADHGLPTTGRIDESLLVELRAAGALDAE